MLARQPLSNGGATLLILDANALLPPRLSDMLFDLHLARLFSPRWTQKIEAEFIRHAFHSETLARPARTLFKPNSLFPNSLPRQRLRMCEPHCGCCEHACTEREPYCAGR